MTVSHVGEEDAASSADAAPADTADVAAADQPPVDPRITPITDLAEWQVEYREGLTGEAGADDEGRLVLAFSGAGEVVATAPTPLALPAGARALQVRLESPGVSEPEQLGEILLRLGSGEELLLGKLDFEGVHVLRHALPAGATVAGLVGRGLFFKDNVELAIQQVAFETAGSATAPAQPAAGPYGDEPSMLPPCDEDVTCSIKKDGISFVFESRSLSAVVRYVYTPIEGNLSDIEVEINNADAIKLSEDGGVSVFMDGRIWPAADEELERHFVSCEQVGDAVEARWQFRHGSELADFLYRLRVEGKSLLVEIEGGGGRAAGIDLGYVSGAVHPRLIRIPYFNLGDEQPLILSTSGVFVSSLLDWNRSAAASLHGVPEEDDQRMHLNGGCRYQPAADGRRPAMRERWVVSVSRHVDEVLPALPVAADHEPTPVPTDRLWCRLPEMAAGEEAYIEAYERLRMFRQIGLNDLLVLHPESDWHDGCGGTPALDTAGAPAKGGDDAFREYLDAVGDLGYEYALHASLRSITPLDAAWSTDRLALGEDGEFIATGPGRYLLKPSCAAELADGVRQRLVEDYGAAAIFVGHHAAEPPWGRVDGDAALPRPASFAATLQHEQTLLARLAADSAVPVVGDGGSHWLYPGLLSGYIARLRGTAPATQPLLVDFGLRDLHTRQVDAGVGSPEEFFGGPVADDDREASLDRYLAATLAFGHAGLLPDLDDWGLPAVAKVYFLLHQLQPLYLRAEIESIHYQRGGNLLETTEALVAGAHELSQVRIVYRNGLTLHVNGAADEDWEVEIDEETTYKLPPASFLARGPNGLLVYSADTGSGRVDYAECDDYLYVDTRGQRLTLGAMTLTGAAILTHHDWIIDVYPLDTQDTVEIAPAELWKGRRLPPLRVLAFRDEIDEPESVTANAPSGGVQIRPEDDVYRYRITLPEWMVEPGT